ncbi:Hypothetical Protein AWT69_001647 [Pseudomonas putida]|nr:Hypothetical Protein AWT69_001647 [Pseudomonas putida]
MILRDWRMLAALGFTVTQQILLALSTYYIARAGLALGQSEVDLAMGYISGFFVFALLGYVASSISSLFSNRASNAAWGRYVADTLANSTEHLQLASEKNKKAIAQWLGGEALSTLGYACAFYVGFISVGLNIVLTLLVFYLSLGWQITMVMAASLVVSLVFVLVLRKRIEHAAGAMQQSKLNALVSVERTWNAAMFGSRAMRRAGFGELHGKVGGYFSEVNRYVLMEQAVACFPIIISTVAVLLLLQYSNLFTHAAIGALVAVLPRSLQVFGSVHSLSIYLSQFYLVRAKLRNLEGFTHTLDTYSAMDCAPLHGVSIIETATAACVAPQALLKVIVGSEIKGGRFTVTGSNGAGKSTFLKLIKQSAPDALLMTPETRFLEFDTALSTGQSSIREIESALASLPSVLMLDEWDANLDEENFRRIDALLDTASCRVIIIEVRHSRQNRSVLPAETREVG